MLPLDQVVTLEFPSHPVSLVAVHLHPKKYAHMSSVRLGVQDPPGLPPWGPTTSSTEDPTASQISPLPMPAPTAAVSPSMVNSGSGLAWPPGPVWPCRHHSHGEHWKWCQLRFCAIAPELKLNAWSVALRLEDWFHCFNMCSRAEFGAEGRKNWVAPSATTDEEISHCVALCHFLVLNPASGWC